MNRRRTSNRTNGVRFEREVAEKLKACGFWALQIPQSVIGQPADIIAIRKDEIKLIDCKMALSGRFSFDRIEPNQREAMKMFERKTKGTATFMVRFKGLIAEVPLWLVEELEEDGKRSISERWANAHLLQGGFIPTRERY